MDEFSERPIPDRGNPAAWSACSRRDELSHNFTFDSALFALRLFGTAGFRTGILPWRSVVSIAGLISSLVAVLIAIYPIIGVSSRLSYASKIASTVIVSKLLGVAVYRGRTKRKLLSVASTSILATI